MTSFANPFDHFSASILIVDDHAAVRVRMRQLISSRPGWVVCGEAGDGAEAIDLALQLKPSVMVMDISMPGMNGLEATRRIREQLPATEVVMVSQHDAEQVVFEAQKAGARGFVVKSQLSADLLPALEAALLHSSRISSPVSQAWHNAISSAQHPAKETFSDPGPHDDLDLMSGGGEMGALMRAHDWSKTPFGPVSEWPQSLRTALRICLDSRFPIVIFWGPELRLLYNDAWRAYLGTTKHPQALGAPGKLIWADIWDTIGPMLESVTRTGEATWENEQLLLFDRRGYLEEGYWTYSYSAIRLDSGEIGGVFSAVHEVTDRVLGSRRLKTLREVADQVVQAKNEADACALTMQSIVRNPNDCPWAIIFSCEDNKATPMVASFHAEKLVPRTLDLSQEDSWAIKATMQTRSPQVFRVRDPESLPPAPFGDKCEQGISIPILGTNRETIAVLTVGISPYRALDNSYQEFLESLARNLAANIQNARAYDEERNRAEALAELDRAKTVFFSNVSHEFRTPLTLMLGPLEDSLAASEALPAEHRQRLEVAHRNSVRLLRLVNTLLDFSRIEAGRIQASYEPTDLAKFTVELASVFRSATERAGLRLLVNCSEIAEPVYVDREMWEKIVFNLLSNAFKFTFEGEIEISLKQAESSVELSVRDTGTGIAERELPHLFERFYRIKGAQGRTFEGSGIGLSLVQELAKLHGGSVRVESQVNRGSTFAVTIPLGKNHLPAVRISAPRTLESTRLLGEAYVQEALRWLPGGETTADDLQVAALLSPAESLLQSERSSEVPARILLVDDNADMREYVRRLLSHQYAVETAADGESALKVARERRPDVILSDIMMPRLDGSGLLKAVRSDEALKNIPVILLSARAGEESRVEGLEWGADDYLIKPFSARELLARVRSQLAMARMRRETADLDHKLRLDAELLAAIVASSDDAIVSKNLDGIITSWNQGAERIFGHTAEEAIGQPITLIIPSNHWDEEVDILSRLRRGERVDHFQTVRKRKDGQMLDVSLTISPIRDSAGRVIGASKVARDITHLKRTEENYRKLAETLEAEVLARTRELEERNADVLRQSEQVRQLSWRLLRTQEEERRHIARELHDSAGQTLAVLALNLAKIIGAAKEAKHAKEGVSGILEAAEETQEIVQQLTHALRTASYLLLPPLLDENGLRSALSWYVQGLRERSGLDIDFKIPKKFGRLPQEMELAVFRVVQECLTNVHRHSGSKTASIRVSREADHILVAIEDQGRGMSADKLAEVQSRGSGVGIRGMRERLRQFEGTLNIESDPTGTRIVVTVPIPADAPRKESGDVETLRATV